MLSNQIAIGVWVLVLASALVQCGPVESQRPRSDSYDDLDAHYISNTFNGQQNKASKGLSEEIRDDYSLLKTQQRQNKVSSMLHFIHKKSHQSLFKKVETMEENAHMSYKSKERDLDSLNKLSASEPLPDYRQMSDSEVLRSFCNTRWVAYCERAITMAIKKHPQAVAELVDTLRRKPERINSNRLLIHRLLELGISKIESAGYDQKIDNAINIVASKNPYLASANTALKMATKLH